MVLDLSIRGGSLTFLEGTETHKKCLCDFQCRKPVMGSGGGAYKIMLT